MEGRGENQAFTTGRNVPVTRTTADGKRIRIPDLDVNRQAWDRGERVVTYTSTPGGRLSMNGRNTNGVKTNTYTPKNDDGSPVIGKSGEVRQSGRTSRATRSQRSYDTRAGMNNISPRVIQAWLDNGMARMVDGNMVGEGGMVIRQKANGNYSMGLSVG